MNPIRNCRLPWSALGGDERGTARRYGARSGHQTSRIPQPHCRWCSHVKVTTYRRAAYALLSVLRRSHEVSGHEPFTGPRMPNAARIMLRLLRSQGDERRSFNCCPLNPGWRHATRLECGWRGLFSTRYYLPTAVWSSTGIGRGPNCCCNLHVINDRLTLTKQSSSTPYRASDHLVGG